MAAIMRSHPIDPNFKEFNVKVQKKCQEPPFNYGRRHEDRVVSELLIILVCFVDRMTLKTHGWPSLSLIHKNLITY